MLPQSDEQSCAHSPDSGETQRVTTPPVLGSHIDAPENGEISFKTQTEDTKAQSINFIGELSPNLQKEPLKQSTAQAPITHRTPFWKIWTLEMTSILLSFVALIVIVVVLSKFDQKGLPNWPLHITLNTFLAFFSTACKAGFMLPVSAAMSHSQWTWFLHARPLYDFHCFDQASRGIWGSLAFLWRINYKNFGSLGAFITIISAITSPLTQLVISYPVRSVPTLGDANTGAVELVHAPRDRMDNVAQKAIMLTTALDDNRFLEPIAPLAPVCSTGNCTFDKYESLGVCMSQANISSHLQIEELWDVGLTNISYAKDPEQSHIIPGLKIWKLSLPGGYEMVHQIGLGLLSDTLSGNQTFGFQNSPNLLQARIISVVLLYANPIIEGNPWNKTEVDDIDVIQTMKGFRHEALEVLFYLCIQTYDSKVENGRDVTRMTSSSSVPVEKREGCFLNLTCNTMLSSIGSCQSDESRWENMLYLESQDPGMNSSNSKERFGSNYLAMEQVAHWLRVPVSGKGMVKYHAEKSPRLFRMLSKHDFTYSLYHSILYLPDSLLNTTRQNNRLTNIFTNLATSLSSQMRLVRANAFSQSAFNISGQAWKQESYVKIDWRWISFLAAELLLATCFFLRVVFSQADYHNGVGNPLRDIKDSSLPVLVALGEECREIAGGGLKPMGELKDAAKRLQVKLSGNKIIAVNTNSGSESSTRSSVGEYEARGL